MLHDQHISSCKMKHFSTFWNFVTVGSADNTSAHKTDFGGIYRWRDIKASIKAGITLQFNSSVNVIWQNTNVLSRFTFRTFKHWDTFLNLSWFLATAVNNGFSFRIIEVIFIIILKKEKKVISLIYFQYPEDLLFSLFLTFDLLLILNKKQFWQEWVWSGCIFLERKREIWAIHDKCLYIHLSRAIIPMSSCFSAFVLQCAERSKISLRNVQEGCLWLSVWCKLST